MKRQAYILILVLLFQGCSPSGLLPDAAQPSPVNTLTAFDNPRSNSEAVAHSATSSLKTTADTGALTGVLILQTENGLKPVADIKIAIGETLSDDEGTERVVAYDPSTAPVAYTDSTGRFVFERTPVRALRPHPRHRAEFLPVVQGRNSRRHPIRYNSRRSDGPGAS